MSTRPVARFVAFMILLAVAVSARGAQPVAPASTATGNKLGDQIGHAVLQFTLGSWWGEVVVVQNGKEVLAQGYGLANEDLTPMTPDSLVDVGDISKQFTAAGVLLLEQRGKLSLDDSIAKYYPDVPEVAKKITLRYILSHTSGLSDRVQLSAMVDDMNRDQLVNALLNSQLQHEPGTVFEYSNRAYSIAAAVIEKASGRPYDDFMREEVFKPAGMTSTGFIDGVGLDAQRQTVRMPPLRVGAKKGPLFAPAASGGWSWARRGTTGAVSTGHDLAKWDAVLRTDVLLNARERARWIEPVQESYGLGLFNHTTQRATRRVWHGGSSPGYKVLFIALLDEATTIIVITNDVGEPDAVVSVIENMLFPPLPESAQASFNVTGMQFDKEAAAYVAQEGLRWDAAAGPNGGVLLTMYRSGSTKPMGTLALSEGSARRCLAAVTDIVRFIHDDPQPTIMAVTVGQTAITADGQADFPNVFKVEVRSAFRGRNPDGSEFNDRRPTLVVIDAGGTVPLVARMDKAASVGLQSALRAGLGGKLP